LYSLEVYFNTHTLKRRKDGMFDSIKKWLLNECFGDNEKLLEDYEMFLKDTPKK